jgi:hypothetical protein
MPPIKKATRSIHAIDLKRAEEPEYSDIDEIFIDGLPKQIILRGHGSIEDVITEVTEFIHSLSTGVSLTHTHSRTIRFDRMKGYKQMLMCHIFATTKLELPGDWKVFIEV